MTAAELVLTTLPGEHQIVSVSAAGSHHFQLRRRGTVLAFARSADQLIAILDQFGIRPAAPAGRRAPRKRPSRATAHRHR